MLLSDITAILALPLAWAHQELSFDVYNLYVAVILVFYSSSSFLCAILGIFMPFELF